MEIFKVVACSPPSCSCPTLTVEDGIDGKKLVIITDDHNGVVIMKIEEFWMLAEKFLAKQTFSGFGSMGEECI